ncbi:MAG: RagB/SusD family nutrient uptake outer membrane protein [Balneolaceae bacterium]
MNKLLKIMLAAGLIVMFQSCDSILEDPEPSTALSQELVLGDPAAVRSVRAGMMGRLHSFTFTTRNMLGPDALADNLWTRQGASRFQSLNTNEFAAGMADGTTYENVYSLVNEANLIIEAVEDGIFPDPLELVQFQGEAYFLRAYAFHNLVKALANDPRAIPTAGLRAGWDRGIIIRTNPTLTIIDADDRARNSVEEVYQQMESDLLNSISLLSQREGPNRFFVQRAAAEALLARVYLFWERWEDANTFAQRALDNTSAVLTSGDDVANIWVPNNPEGIFITLIDPATESQGVNNSLAVYTSTQWTAQVPTQDLIDLYEEDDLRIKLTGDPDAPPSSLQLGWYGPCFDDARGQNFVAECSLPPGAGLEIQKYTSFGNTQFADNVPLLRTAEMVLIQAEARLKSQGVAAGINRLNLLRESRGLAPLDPANFTEASALDEILDERRRELTAEGHRFYDLRRNRRDIRKPPGSGFSDIPFTDFKYLDNVPFAEVETNELLEQNPGY